jgi:CDP-4-dehydro-6-deoxyglucose reductase, E3
MTEARERRVVELVEATMLSPSVRSLTFSVAGGACAYTAGQWVNLYVPTPDGEIMRAYSIASAPDPARRERFEIAVTYVAGGPVSTALHALALGARMEMDGPWGFFTRADAPSPPQPAVFVGTGTGLSPLRAMLQEELRRGGEAAGPPLVLLFGCRTEADILYGDEIAAWAKHHPRFRYEVTLSRPSSDWKGRAGYVQAHLPELVAPLRPVQVYVCGLSKMVKDVRRILKEDLGLDRRSIHTERYD